MFIGIDVGTTSVKAGLFDAAGRIHARFAERHETQRPKPGHVEQDPDDWMRLVLRGLAAMNDAAGGSVDAIGLCSQVNTHVFVDDVGKPLMPAITWQDGRAAADAAALDARVSAADKIKWWRAPMPIDASHVLARMAHVAKHHPEVWAKTRWVLAPKDFCLQQLTGAVMTDAMTSFGIVDQDLKMIRTLIDIVPGASNRLPPLAGFTAVVGKIGNGLPCAGVPVVTGTMDAWSGLLGAGAARDGDGLYLSGTSEILGIVSEQRAAAPGVIAFPTCEGIVFHAGPTQAGGAALAWAGQLLGRSTAELVALAAHADRSRPVPLFLPHLEGERAPLWDVTSRGSFAGLSSSAGAAEVALAVMEGVAYSTRWVFDSLAVSACRRPELIYHAGGGAASDLWAQIRADVLGVPLQRTAAREAGVVGAALMAAVGQGAFSSLADAVQRFVQMERRFEPDRRAAERHAKRFAAYKALYEQLKPVNAGLA